MSNYNEHMRVCGGLDHINPSFEEYGKVHSRTKLFNLLKWFTILVGAINLSKTVHIFFFQKKYMNIYIIFWVLF